MASHNDKTSVVDADSHFIIDPVTRTIQNDGEKNLVQFDHNSERKTFECPRFVEGHDMLNCNRVIVNYLDNDLPGVYEVDDLTKKDSDTIMFSWLISSNATQKTGNIFFAITFMCVQTNGDVTYRWNTAINQGLKVIEGMNQNSTIVYDNVDILEQWKQQLFGTSDGEISKIQEATNECLKKIPSDYSALNTKVDKNTTSISELKESLDYESTMIKDEMNDFIDKSNNLFNKESVSDGFYGGSTGKLSINSAYCCVMIPFTCKDTITITGTNYDQCYYDSNKTFIGSSTLKGKPLTINGATVIGRNPQTNEKLNNKKICYIGINIEKNEYDLNQYMICSGETLSDNYEPYGVKRIKKDVKIDYSQINGAPTIYTVGSDGDYTSFTDCLKDLENIEHQKIIYVKTGTYDIFTELGGSDYINTLDVGNLNWRDVQPIVPPNTKIIGQGNVVLKFAPTAEEIKNKDIAFLFSPLNISYATDIENIKIDCTNCRYAIHFETNGLIEYADGKSRFKNLVCHKKSGRFGNPQVFGSGIGRRNQWEFDSCIFTSDMPNIWTTHTNTSKEDDSCTIVFNNCIFTNDIESETTKKRELVQFISGGAKIGHKCTHNYVRMNNCYVGGRVGLSYQGSETEEKQQFDLIMLKCDTQGVNISEKFGENPYVPKIY